jgi:hypothetical protein
MLHNGPRERYPYKFTGMKTGAVRIAENILFALNVFIIFSLSEIRSLCRYGCNLLEECTPCCCIFNRYSLTGSIA